MKRFLTILIGLLLFVCIGQMGQADWTYNPFTGKLDYHETGLPTGTSGDIAYYDGSDWVALNKGSNGEVLTLAAGLPSWAASGAGADVKVGIDAAATAGYFGIAFNDGIFRWTQNQFTMADGGDFVTLSLADHNAARTALGLAIGTDVQAQSANLNTYSGIAPSANVQTFLGAVNYAAMITQLSLTIGTNTQAHDNALDDISGLVYASGSFVALTANDDYTVRTYAQTLSDIGAAASSHAMSTHSDEDTYSISTSGDITADHVGLGGAAVNADYGINYSKTLTDTDNSWKAGLYIVPALAKIAAAMTSSGQGIWVEGRLDGTNTQNWSNTVGVRGVAAQINTEGASTGTVTGAASFYTEASINDGATITNLYGLYISTPSVVNNKATNEYGIYIANQDSGQTLNYAIYTGTGLVRFGGVLHADGGIVGPAAVLDINTSVIQDVNFWDTIASGNPSINIYGWNTAGGDRESFSFSMGDTNDEAVLTIPNSANNEGFTVNLGETNQRFRLRQNSDAFSIRLDATNVLFHTTDGQFIFDTDEGAAHAALGLTDSDGSNVVYVSAPALAGDWTLTLPAAVAATAGGVFYDSDGAGTALWSATLLHTATGAEIATAAGETSLELDDGTTQYYFELSSAEGLAEQDLRISIDENASNQVPPIIICGEDERNTDFGLTLLTYPQLVLSSATGSSRAIFKYNGYLSTADDVYITGSRRVIIESTGSAITTGDFCTFESTVDLTHDTADQAYVFIHAQVDKDGDNNGDSAYAALKIRVNEFDASGYDTASDNYIIDAGLTATTWGVGRLGEQVYAPSSAQVIDAVGDAVLANATMVVMNPDGDYTLTSTPHIADGFVAGQILIITCANGEANTVTFQNQADLGGSNLNLGAASRAVSGTDVLMLIFDGTDWNEISFANN